MPAIAVSADGEYLFVAAENDSGFPVIIREARDTGVFTAAYNPGAGTAANVQASGDPDVIFFYGNFGSGAQVIRHVVSGPTNTNISPAGLTTKVVNGLAVNPADANEIIITVNTDQDLLYTSDGGSNWSTLNAALGFNPTALFVIWGGNGEPHQVYVAGKPASVQLLFSPNDGANFDDIAGASLAATANIAGVEIVR